MEKLFRLSQYETSVSKEILCGITTFLTMSYILFVNPAVVSESGMPASGIFAATVLTSAFCCLVMGFVANAPFAMASGMGLNTFFTYIACLSLGFKWQEALGLMFIAGLVHILVMATGLRKALVNAIPQHLKMSFAVGLGFFIGYTGLKSGGFLTFTTPPGQYEIFANGTVVSNSSVVPALIGAMGAPQIIALIGLAVMLCLIALERKTGDNYAALPIGILTAAFVGIPLNVTHLVGVTFLDLSSVLEVRQVFGAFWGDPGLLSIVGNPDKILLSGLVILILLVTNVMDSVGTIIGTGQVQDGAVFSDEDVKEFSRKKSRTKLDRVLVCNSIGGSVAALMGTTTVTTYMESITGIVAGGRTGLTAVTVGCMFLLCLPFANFFSVIPAHAIAPALIVAGAFMLPLVARINWSSFEEAFPAFATAMCIPLTYSFVYGIAAGVLSHVVIQLSLGKWRGVHPMLYGIALIFLFVVGIESWM